MRSLILKKFWSKFFYSKIVFICFVLLSFYVLYKSFFIVSKLLELRDNNNFLLQKSLELQQKQAKLVEKINFIQTERGIEKVLREEYNLSKTEEKEIVMHKLSPENHIIQEIDNIYYVNLKPNIFDYLKYFINNYTNLNFR